MIQFFVTPEEEMLCSLESKIKFLLRISRIAGDKVKIKEWKQLLDFYL